MRSRHATKQPPLYLKACLLEKNTVEKATGYIKHVLKLIFLITCKGKEAGDTDLVARLDCATEDSPKGIKGAAVLLGVQLGHMHQQGTSGIACLHMLHNLSILGTCVQALYLRRQKLGVVQSPNEPGWILLKLCCWFACPGYPYCFHLI